MTLRGLVLLCPLNPSLYFLYSLVVTVGGRV